jgi:two-component system CheB/CheR fusion protein
MSETTPHHIIAIGASAGGMEEINLFFDHTPLDGVAYVIIQHLSPDFKSRMLELLSRHSKLKVKEAENRMTVICNQVYLIPHDKFMTIKNGMLILSEKENVKGPHLTINTFFNSLAADCGKKAIGIILSGLGSDGTEGIKAIKNAGGMVIARSPANSEFSSMPSSAIATGLVDFVLEPALMPAAIEDYVKNSIDLLTDNSEDDKNLKAIIDLIKETSPLDFSDYKQTTILRRTKRRATYGNFTSLSDYLNFLKVTPEEIESLTKEFLISVSSFFRDSEAFEYIQKKVLPDILKKLIPGEELKIWVAGCATGEEVYSLAILVDELLTGKLKDKVVKIFATDIDSAALLYAGKGLYNYSISKDISSERLNKYFIKEGDKLRVTQSIRKMVIFAQHDLVKNPPYCNMHLISCRNLLIYMTPILQKKIFTMLLFGLKLDGYLFLGSSENPISILKDLEVVHKKWKIYKNLKIKKGINFDAFSLPDLMDIKRSPSRFVTEEIDKGASTGLSEAIHLKLANDLDYLAICVNESNQVQSSYGNTSAYLLQKHFTSNLTELLPKPLAIAYKILFINALNENKKVNVRGIKFKKEKSIIKVNLSVSPIIFNAKQKLLLVIFTKDSTVNTEDDSIFDEKVYLDHYTKSLEDEVKELKEQLQASYERLDASNENMQSFNEELISANEEMQSTNEEMQSVNEELHTINSDYQIKNKELIEINDDLNNYFRSNINGQLIINNDLELIKFSPSAVNQINLLETDIGRPLSNITTNIKFETIISDIEQVLLNGTVIRKEIETQNGNWYQVKTMPYYEQASNRNNGAIITFNDITELKKTQAENEMKNKTLLRINEDLDHFIHAASHDLLAPLGNIETSINIMNKIHLSDSKLMDFLNIINISVKKFRELIIDIAAVAKIEDEMNDQELVDLDEIIENIEWSLDDKIKLSGAVITRRLGVKQIPFSKKNLRSILFNLISNAIKFKGEEAPNITIITWKEADKIILSVKDNGRGIPKDGLNKIFDIYGRIKQDIEGQGIGLYLAKKIINAAGGEIIVESEPGIGSDFMLHIKTENEN